MTYTSDEIEAFLEQKGELIVTIESGRTLELHRHDTAFSEEEIHVHLSDGGFSFTPDRIESLPWHTQSTDEIGL